MAIEFVQEAIEIAPGLSVNYFVFAMTYAELGDKQKARDAVKSLLIIDPNFSSEAYTQGVPFSDPAMHAQRELALKKASMPE